MTKEGIKFKTTGLFASLKKSIWLTNPSSGKRPSKNVSCGQVESTFMGLDI